MTVNELIEELKKIAEKGYGDTVVQVCCDSEYPEEIASIIEEKRGKEEEDKKFVTIYA